MDQKRSGLGELRHGILGIFDALAVSVALLSLALGVAFASSGAAGEAGIAAPFAYLIAGVGSLCLASVIIRFTRRMASAGGLYTYISRGLSPSAGFLGGWLYGGGFAVGISFVLVIGSFFMSVAMSAHTGIHWGWYPWFFIFLAAPCAARLSRHPHLDPNPADRRRDRRQRNHAAGTGDPVQGGRLGLLVRAAQPGQRDLDERPLPRRRAHVHRLHRLRGRRRPRRRGGEPASLDTEGDPDGGARRARLLRVRHLDDGAGLRRRTTRPNGRRTQRRSTRSQPAMWAAGWP